MKAIYPASPGPLVHTGSGKLLGLLISHNQTSVQTVTIYDNTTATGTVLLVVSVSANQCPALLEFPRDIPITFAAGLYLSIPANVNAYAWAIGFDA